MARHGTTNGHLARETILVSGGAGYVGSLLVRRLLDRAYRVRVLDSLLYGDDGIRPILSHPNLELVIGDFRHADVVERAVGGVHAVIHLGAIVGDPACALDEDFAVETNFEATCTIVKACKWHGVSRLVFASTCSVYGASEDALDEEAPLNPVSLYANTKIAAETALLQEQCEAFTPVVLRFGTAYGASHRPRFDLVVNLLTAKAVVDGRITIHGGSQWRPFVHVDDIGRALVLALEAPTDQVTGQVFNVGATEQNYQLAQVGELIRAAIPTARVITNAQIVDHRNYYVRFDKVRRILGFHPTRDLSDGILEIKTSLENGAVSEYRDRRYNNRLFLSETSRQGQHPVTAS